MPHECFEELLATGSATQRGRAHGEHFRDKISATLEYYRTLFGLGDEELMEQAIYYAAVIANFSQDYRAEIEGIAEGARLSPWLIYALNSRSEILNNCSVSECTAVLNTEERLLGQNWDWSEPLENLVILLRIEREDGHRIATLTEPGMLAKVGLNSSGLGVCLNILKHDTRLRGIPVHILLRAVLDCEDIALAKALVETHSPGKASHILVADDKGEHLSVEFAGESHHLLTTTDGLLWHSNHYLAAEALNTEEAFPSTRERFLRAGELLADNASEEGLWQTLQNQSEGEMSICRPYSPSATAAFGKVGTVFSMLVNLTERSMRVRRGCSPASPHYTISV